jgi:aspartyl-tRNA(Asn)/glutamyl-tRNA(Gln) amidotransferase subunit A
MTLRAIAGHDPRDGYTWDAPVPDYCAALTGEVRGLRLGVVTEQMESPLVDTEVRDSVRTAVSSLADLGVAVQEVSIPLSVHQGTISGGLRVEAPTNYRRLLLERLRDIRHDNRIGYLVGSILPAQAYYKTQKLRTLLRRQVFEALEKVDVLAMPTSGEAAQSIVPDPIITSKEDPNRIGRLLTPLFSLANVTAISVPCGFTSDGLPIALQLAAKPFQEATVLNAAYAYEQATSWHTRRPPNV